MSFNRIDVQNYNFPVTLLGGQSFAWDFDGDEFTGFTKDSLMKLKFEAPYLYWQTYPEKDNFDLVKNYLQLDRDYNSILSTFPDDEYLNQAKNKFNGIRILKQPFDETLISYLFSATKSIKSIRTSMRIFTKKFGNEINVDGETYYLFPQIETIANTSIDDLLECRIGFRARNVKAAAKVLLDEDFTNKIVNNLNEEEVRDELTKLHGVGTKIADCVLTYSLGFDNVMPLDRWGIRILTNYYGLDEKTKYEDMKTWYQNYFGSHSAWAGQMLFEYIRGFEV